MKNTRLIPRLWYSALIAILLISYNSTAYAQNIIKGTIISKDDGLSIIGATVQLKGSNKGTITDFDGHFSLPVEDKGVLVVSFIGYQTKNIQIKPNQKYYKIYLSEQTVELDDVVVVGYGTMRKKEVTGAVARVGSEDLSKVATSDIGMALQGQIAGVNVQAGTGGPGSKANIQIRGLSSISGSSAPLFVVDGIPQEGDPGLSDNEIESIDVLKDAASAAIYGTRGAGGVILITTKKGKIGVPKISFDAYYGTQLITSQIDLLNASEYMYVKILQNRLTGASKDTDDQAWSTLQNYPNNFFNNTEINSVVQNNLAPISNYAINLSGGKDNITYNLSGSYFDQDGVIINSYYKRYTARSNTTFKKNKWTVSSNVSFKIENKQSPAFNMLVESYNYKPTQSYIHPDMGTASSTGENSEVNQMTNTMAKLKEDNKTDTENFTGNFSVDYQIVKDLKVSTRLVVNYTNAKQVIINPLFEIYDADGNLRTSAQGRSGIRNNHAKNQGLTWEALVNYNKKIQKHDIKLTGAYSLERYRFNQFFAQVKDLVSNDIPSLGAGSSDMLVGTGKGQWGQDRTTTLVGMLARAQYNYANRYMVSGSIRRDGSSRFAENNRWGMFPSVSAGWNISEERFYKPIRKIINSLKLRASYGTTGNQNFGDYSYAATVSNRYDYAFGSSYNTGEFLQSGMAQTAYANADVKWETTKQINAGIDASFFDNKLTLNADYYESNKVDMLFPMLIPPSAGVGNSSTVVLNLGNMRNRGVELAVGHNNQVGKVRYRLNLTAATNSNEITKMSASNTMYYFSDGTPVVGGATADKVTVVAEGYPAGAFFVMPTNGIANTEQKLAAYQKLRPSARMGDLIYEDRNGDGLINDDDRVYAGHGAPEFEIGLVANVYYAGFDFSMNWYASLGNEIINGSKIYTSQNQMSKDLLYQWNPNNPTSLVPTFYSSSHDNYRAYTDIWVEDGSFLRLKNIMLGYSFPKRMLKKLHISKLRLYAASDNLVTLTAYDGYDPEVGSNGLSKRGLDLGNYPISLQIRGGVQIEF